MIQKLDPIEARVIGSLIEKSVVTPDQYPMTLNALTNACNQKSARNPVMALSQGEVQHALRVLEAKHLVRAEENFKSRTEKYAQRFCSTRYSDHQFDSEQVAIVCLLLLRGPQTPGELRARSGRLHTFSDNDDVVRVLSSLIEREGDPFLTRLPRTPGRRDAEYMHLFSGAVDVEAHVAQEQAASSTGSASRTKVSELADRVSQLEVQVAELQKQLK